MKTNTELIAEFIADHVLRPVTMMTDPFTLGATNLDITVNYTIKDDYLDGEIEKFARFYQRMGCWFYNIGSDNARYSGQVPPWDTRAIEALNSLQMELLETATATA